MTSLIGVFAPASVAIAGAGMQTAGECYLNSLLAAGFKGRLYPLNPKGGEISGLRVYPHLREVPGTVDYVVSCVPALSVPQLVRECSEKGVKWMSLFTAGFSETGTESGRNLEAQIVRLARAGGVRLIGPNCMGVYCPESGMVFASDLPLERGKVAFICQSGGNAIYFVRLAAERGIKFSKVVSYGNACDVNESELIDCLADDSETEVLALYIEGPKDGQRLYGALSRAAARKPVVVLKGGTTEAGARTVASHTGSLAGSREVWEVMLEQAGAIGVDTLDEMVDMVVTLSFLPLPGGKNAAIVTGGGGASVLATDACAMNGFRVPPVPESVAAMFRSHRETDVGFILTNPVELNMFPELSFEMAKELLAHHDFDLLLANCVFGQQPWPMFAPWYELFCSNVVKVSTVCHKPIAVVLHVTLQSLRQQAMDLQRRYVDAGLPVYYSVAAACRAIDRLMRHHAKRLAKTRLS